MEQRRGGGEQSEGIPSRRLGPLSLGLDPPAQGKPLFCTFPCRSPRFSQSGSPRRAGEGEAGPWRWISIISHPSPPPAAGWPLKRSPPPHTHTPTRGGTPCPAASNKKWFLKKRRGRETRAGTEDPIDKREARRGQRGADQRVPSWPMPASGNVGVCVCVGGGDIHFRSLVP